MQIIYSLLLSRLPLHEVIHVERESARQPLCSLWSECEMVVILLFVDMYKVVKFHLQG